MLAHDTLRFRLSTLAVAILRRCLLFFFFNDSATHEIFPSSLPGGLSICANADSFAATAADSGCLYCGSSPSTPADFSAPSDCNFCNSCTKMFTYGGGEAGFTCEIDGKRFVRSSKFMHKKCSITDPFDPDPFLPIPGQEAEDPPLPDSDSSSSSSSS